MQMQYTVLEATANVCGTRSSSVDEVREHYRLNHTRFVKFYHLYSFSP